MSTIPEPIRSGKLLPVVSVSGGKDSTATVLHMRELGVDVAAYVFADTGWEALETYAYLDLLRERLAIKIHVVRSDRGGMIEIARRKAGFPLRKGRWCTEDLKVKPIKAFRESMPGETVLAIHHRHGIPVNPLYLRGHDRVGCYPCIFAQKEEVRLLAEHSPERIAELRALEAEFSAERVRRNATGEGEFAHTQATFFHTRHPAWPSDIDSVVGWSRTTKGGRCLPMLPEPPMGGCMKWGLCEAPPREPA